MQLSIIISLMLMIVSALQSPEKMQLLGSFSVITISGMVIVLAMVNYLILGLGVVIYDIFLG